MANKTKIAIHKEYNLLTVFFDDDTKVDELPQTTDSTALEAMINSVKVAEWDVKLLSIEISPIRIVILNETFPSDSQLMEEIDYTSLSAPQQTIVNDFIALL